MVQRRAIIMMLAFAVASTPLSPVAFARDVQTECFAFVAQLERERGAKFRPRDVQEACSCLADASRQNATVAQELSTLLSASRTARSRVPISRETDNAMQVCTSYLVNDAPVRRY